MWPALFLVQCRTDFGRSLTGTEHQRFLKCYFSPSIVFKYRRLVLYWEEEEEEVDVGGTKPSQS